MFVMGHIPRTAYENCAITLCVFSHSAGRSAVTTSTPIGWKICINAAAVLPHSFISPRSSLVEEMTDENLVEEKVKPEFSDHRDEIVQLQTLGNSNKEEHGDSSDPESAESSSNDDFPEGGLRAWSCVAGSYVSIARIPTYVNVSNTLKVLRSSGRFWVRLPNQ